MDSNLEGYRIRLAVKRSEKVRSWPGSLDRADLTDKERAAVWSIASDPDVVKAILFGSRATRVRTGRLSRKSDIDLAIELTWPGDESGDICSAIDFREKHAATIAAFGIDIDWHGLGFWSEAFHADGFQIWP